MHKENLALNNPQWLICQHSKSRWCREKNEPANPQVKNKTNYICVEKLIHRNFVKDWNLTILLNGICTNQDSSIRNSLGVWDENGSPNSRQTIDLQKKKEKGKNEPLVIRWILTIKGSGSFDWFVEAVVTVVTFFWREKICVLRKVKSNVK